MTRALAPVTLTPAPDLGDEHYRITTLAGKRVDAAAAESAASAIRAEVLTATVFDRPMGVALNDAGEITRAWLHEGTP